MGNYCDICDMRIVHTISTRNDYEIYLNRVERDNFARDMYDGDTYMGYEYEMSFEEWLEEHGEETYSRTV